MHIPFCRKRCKYCDFYSSFVTEDLLDNYTDVLIGYVKEWGGKLKNRPIDTIYLGGGTPSLLEKRLVPLITAVKENFSVCKNSEITLELNPSNNPFKTLEFAKETGINRLSIGVQSAKNLELKLLGRQHTFEDTVKTVEYARKLGFNNISLDIMLGLPFSSLSTLNESLENITDLKPEHISAYILKIEENTAFFANKDSLCLPDDDQQAEQYLYMCSFLENKGFRHYEISNFCKDGFRSRHNMKYWLQEEYLGIGPSAHSFLDGKRFFYPKDLRAFLRGCSPVQDSLGGGKEEYIMLRLRLYDGIKPADFCEKFGCNLPLSFLSACEEFIKIGLMRRENGAFALTNDGMLVSNTIITKLLECLE